MFQANNQHTNSFINSTNNNLNICLQTKNNNEDNKQSKHIQELNKPKFLNKLSLKNIYDKSAYCYFDLIFTNDFYEFLLYQINKKITKLKGIFSHHAGPSWQYHPKEPSIINVPNYPYIRLPRGYLFFLNK